MTSSTLVRWLAAGSLLLLPLHAALAQPPAKPTDAEVRTWIQRLERRNDQPARLQALQWLQKHATAPNVRLAIPVLERTIREDAVSKVRLEALLAIFDVAKKQKLPCPLIVVQTIFDQDAAVRQDAGALATQFTAFAPGTVDLALRASWSEEIDIRNDGLNLLALAAPHDSRALAVLETAKNDRSFQIRHNAHCYKFQADGRLDEFLTWLIRLQEDNSVLEPIPKDEKLRKQEESIRNLSILGNAVRLKEWSEKRPDDLAAALLQMLDHKSALVRRGAVRLIGATAAQWPTGKAQFGKQPGSVTSLLPLPPSEAGSGQADRHLKPDLQPSKVAGYLQKRKARQRLEKVRANDPDRSVRDAAQSSLKLLARLQIER